MEKEKNLKNIRQEFRDKGIFYTPLALAEMKFKDVLNIFDPMQIRVIALGMQDGLDISPYANPEFSSLQMIELYAGIRDGLDVSKYADRNMCVDDMRTERHNQLIERNRKWVN